VEILITDCTASNRFKIVKHRLPEDEQVGVLVNNAEASLSGGLFDHSMNQSNGQYCLIFECGTCCQYHHGAFPCCRFWVHQYVSRRPEFGRAFYRALKAFGSVFHRPCGMRVRAVLPTATRTEVWKRLGKDVDTLPAVMEV
jgi:short-subunit dehydrogenase